MHEEAMRLSALAYQLDGLAALLTQFHAPIPLEVTATEAFGLGLWVKGISRHMHKLSEEMMRQGNPNHAPS